MEKRREGRGDKLEASMANDKLLPGEKDEIPRIAPLITLIKTTLQCIGQQYNPESC